VYEAVALTRTTLAFGAERDPPQKWLARWSEFACQPAQRISFKGVYWQGNFLNAMTGAALESPLLKASQTGRHPSQTHPVLAGRTHRPVGNGITHNLANVGSARRFGLYASGLSRTNFFHTS
jgi:hypothetical protein